MICILLLGCTGMAGHVIKEYLAYNKTYKIYTTSRLKELKDNQFSLDVFEPDKVSEIVESVKPSIIINCIGSLIRESTTDPDVTIYVNSYFPHLLAKIAKKHSSKVIHLSTDCVFNGNKGEYSDSDTKDAIDIYGQSKSLGEIISNNNLTIRTSIIGPELKNNGEGLFHWFLQEKGSVNGFKEVMWSGITTLELAKFIDYIIPKNVSGLVQITNGKKISKYDLLKLIQSTFNKKDVQIIENRDKKADKSLIVSKVVSSFNFNDYDKMLIDLKHFMEVNKGLYSQYRSYL